MKPTFHAIQVNGPFEDPCIYIRILREKRAILFDAGYIGRIELGNLLKVSDIFITHTHMDHFVGFDTVLRAMLRRETPLRVFGPQNIIDCIEGKLKGYTWNLIKDYPLQIEAYGVSDNLMEHASFYAESGFNRINNPSIKFDGFLLVEPMFRVKGILLSHQIPVMAYSIEEEKHININKSILSEMGLKVGPWLSEFKKAIRQGHEDRTFVLDGKTYKVKELMPIATITKGQKISYVMDVSPTDENIEKIITFVNGSDHLFCEAYFLDKDRDRAEKRHHLTAAIAGKIAREAMVGNLTIMHFSPKYRHIEEELYQEAEREFKS